MLASAVAASSTAVKLGGSAVLGIDVEPLAERAVADAEAQEPVLVEKLVAYELLEELVELFQSASSETVRERFIPTQRSDS